MATALYEILLQVSGIMLRLLRTADAQSRVSMLGLLCMAVKELLADVEPVVAKAITDFYVDIRDREGVINTADYGRLSDIIIMVNPALSSSGAATGSPVVSVSKTPEQPTLGFLPDVLIPEITNANYFRLSYSTMRKQFGGHGRFFYLRSSIDMTEFPVMEKLMELPALSDVFYYWQENMALLKPKDARMPCPVYSVASTGDYRAVFIALRDKGYSDTIRWYDRVCPQPVSRDLFLPIYAADTTGSPLTIYFNLYKAEHSVPSNPLAVKVTRQLCCASKAQIRNAYWAHWDTDIGFDSLLSYMTGAGIISPGQN